MNVKKLSFLAGASAFWLYLLIAKLSRYPKDTLGDRHYFLVSLGIGAAAALATHWVMRRKAPSDPAGVSTRLLATSLAMASALAFSALWPSKLPNPPRLDWFVLVVSLAAVLSLWLPARIQVNRKTANVALTIMIGVGLVAYSIYSLLQHYQFRTACHDLGILHQLTYVLSRFETPITTITRGSPVNYFESYHLHPILYLFAPFMWLHSGSETMLLLEIASIAIGTIPPFLLARERTGNNFFALVVAFSYFFWVGLQKMIDYPFHTESFGHCILSWLAYFLYYRRWRFYALFLVLSFAVREDYAVYLSFLAVVMIISKGRRIAGITTLVASALLYLFSVEWRSLWTDAPYPWIFTPERGGDTVTYFSSLLTKTQLFTRQLTDSDQKSLTPLFYLASFGFLPLLSPISLLGLPMLAARYLQPDNMWGRWTVSGYAGAFTVVPLVYATIFATGYLVKKLSSDDAQRTRLNRLAWLLLICSSIVNFTTVARRVDVFWGYGQPVLEALARKDFYHILDEDSVRSCHQMVKLIPSDASVAASCQLAPHLTGRRHIYSPGVNPINPDQIDYLALESYWVSWPMGTEDYRQFMKSFLDNSNFGVRYAKDRCFLLEKGVTSTPEDLEEVRIFLAEMK